MSQNNSEIFDELPKEVIDGSPLIDHSDAEIPSKKKKPPKPSTSENENSAGMKISNRLLLPVVALLIICGVVFGLKGIMSAGVLKSEAALRMDAGHAAILENNMESALYQFTRALEANPKILTAHSSLGKIALARGRGQEAARHFEAELELDPDNRDSHLALGCLNALGCIGENDPNNIRHYLIDRFADVLPLDWSGQLTYTPPEDEDALAGAIYQFQSALELSPDDPAPGIGIALSYIAVYDLASARDRLNRMLGSIDDDNTNLIVRRIISDINDEEQYIAMGGDPVDIVEEDSGIHDVPPLNFVPPPSNPDLSELPPINGGGANTAGFGDRLSVDPDMPEAAGMDIRLQESDMYAHPTVKPINNDIHLEGSNEFVHTVRIGNIYEQGMVGFREGETIVMPHTNNQVTVLKKSDDEIVIQEGENIFTWIPDDVGWTLKPEEIDDSLDISVVVPENDGTVEAPLDPATENELGPEIDSTD
jgi:tetratricopeptide (TPR) repeat protein